MCAAAPYRPGPLLPHGTTPASYKVLIDTVTVNSIADVFLFRVLALYCSPKFDNDASELLVILLLCITRIVYTCKVVLSEGVLGNGYYYRS